VDVKRETIEGAVHEEGAIAFVKMIPFSAISSILGEVLSP
jgi:hypothetical protein